MLRTDTSLSPGVRRLQTGKVLERCVRISPALWWELGEQAHCSPAGICMDGEAGGQSTQILGDWGGVLGCALFEGPRVGHRANAGPANTHT